MEAIQERLINSSPALLGAIAGGTLLAYSLAPGRKSNLPPGPKRLPVIGNVHQMPQEAPWLVFSEWSKTYGDIIHVDVFGQSIVIINSTQAAKDLLDKRSTIYSDRPVLEMASLCGYNRTFVLQHYGDEWRKQRRLVAQDFGMASCPKYYDLQNKEARILVRNILKDPSSLESEIKLRIGIIIIRTTYGYYVQSPDDPILANPLTAMDNFSKSTAPGNFLVDFVPSLKGVPGWVPGSGFLQTAKEWKKIMEAASWNPVNFCRDNLETGKTLMPNLCGNIYQEAGGKLSKEAEEQLVWASSSVLGGGLDTNMSSALTFFMAMILNPRVQKKAQAELDEVVGKDRLPSIADQANLPYIRSIMAEVFRYFPAIPLSIPHASTQDDEYNGIFIPKGSLIMPNVWHMLHDSEIYPSPMEFFPERYNGLDSEMDKVKDLAFGFGRRVCPGMHFAEGTLFAIISTTLATCDILPGLDENGNEVLPKYRHTAGTIR
ncbi:putative monooxygenase [Panaeolus papilionaceus]|nr:putative monooxygenase [Panaeolus papilionaceus]